MKIGGLAWSVPSPSPTKPAGRSADPEGKYILIFIFVYVPNDDVSDGHRSRVVRLLLRPYLGGAFPPTRFTQDYGAQYRPLRF